MKFWLIFLMFISFMTAHAAVVTVRWDVVDTNVISNTLYITTPYSTNFTPLVKLPASTRSYKFKITDGYVYKLYAVSENRWHIPSDPSKILKVCYPTSAPPAIISATISCDRYSKTNNTWYGVLIYWPPAADKYAVSEYRLHYETQSQTNVWVVKTNSYKISSVPVKQCRFFVEQVNAVGVSPVTPRSYLIPNEKRPEKISDTLEK